MCHIIRKIKKAWFPAWAYANKGSTLLSRHITPPKGCKIPDARHLTLDHPDLLDLLKEPELFYTTLHCAVLAWPVTDRGKITKESLVQSALLWRQVAGQLRRLAEYSTVTHDLVKRRRTTAPDAVESTEGYRELIRNWHRQGTLIPPRQATRPQPGTGPQRAMRVTEGARPGPQQVKRVSDRATKAQQYGGQNTSEVCNEQSGRTTLSCRLWRYTDESFRTGKQSRGERGDRITGSNTGCTLATPVAVDGRAGRFTGTLTSAPAAGHGRAGRGDSNLGQHSAQTIERQTKGQQKQTGKSEATENHQGCGDTTEQESGDIFRTYSPRGAEAGGGVRGANASGRGAGTT
mmetsp:Transcript_30050/g.61887  ORF Transcript_30050/g.61887 Transcript_30050/m.61887 type:complete len:347 (+) Transcript_30050:720-1760(+)